MLETRMWVNQSRFGGEIAEMDMQHQPTMIYRSMVIPQAMTRIEKDLIARDKLNVYAKDLLMSSYKHKIREMHCGGADDSIHPLHTKSSIPPSSASPTSITLS